MLKKAAPALLLCGFAAIVFVCVHVTPSQPVALSEVPYPVNELQALSAKLLKKDESESFKESVLHGEQGKLLSRATADAATSALLPSKKKAVSSPASHVQKAAKADAVAKKVAAVSRKNVVEKGNKKQEARTTKVDHEGPASIPMVHTTNGDVSTLPRSLSGEDTMTLAKTVSKMFDKKAIKMLASKKRHAAGVKAMKKRANDIQAKEEAAALQSAIQSSDAAAAKLRAAKQKLIEENKADAAKMNKLAAEIKLHRNDLMKFGRHGEEKQLGLVEEAKMFDQAAAQLEAKAQKLLSSSASQKAAAAAKKAAAPKVKMSKREEKLLERNKKVIARYNQLKKEMKEDQHEASDIMKRAALARTKALANMQRAGSLLSQADNTPSRPKKAVSPADQKKMQAKLRGQSGSLTRQAVSLLLGTHQAAKKAYALREKAQALQVKLGDMRSSVHAARLSDRILEDPSLLKHPREFDKAESPSHQNAQSMQAKKKAESFEHLAAADRARADALRDAYRKGQPAPTLDNIDRAASGRAAQETRQALLAQEETLRLKEMHIQRRKEAGLARQLGDEMNTEQQLKAAIKKRKIELRALQKKENVAEHREAFETSVFNRIQE